MIITLLAFLLTLGVLVAIHEYGHYRVAVACDVKVLRFSLGFGPVVWRRVFGKDQTEFTLCGLPLGGYVRMLDEREEGVSPSERHRAFNRKTLWQRSAIVAAGPAANLLLAVLLYSTAHWIGVDEPRALLGTPTAQSPAERSGLRAGDWVQAWSSDGQEWEDVRSMTDLRWQLTQSVIDSQPISLLVTDREGHSQRRVTLPLDAFSSRDVDAGLMRRIGLGAPWSAPVLGQVKDGGAGARAGLLAGDEVLSVDGRPVADSNQLRERIRASVDGDEPLTMQWELRRSGQVLRLAVEPVVSTDAGRPIGRIEVFVGAPPQMVTVSYGPMEGLTAALRKTWDMSVLTVQMLGRMLIGEASLKNLSGPVTIADYAGQSVQLGLAYYLGFLAVVSVSLGVLNLLPLPMLDGGHLMYHLFEGVTGKPVSDLWLERLQRGGIVVLAMMMSVALYNDMARLLGLH